MRRIALLCVLFACKTPPKQGTTVIEPVSQAEKSHLEQIHHSFLRRETWSCPTQVQFGFDPTPHLFVLAETVEMPPWVAIRSAACAVRHAHETGQAFFEKWIQTIAWAGLGRVVLSELDALPEEKAVALTRLALESELQAYATKTLKDSKYERVRQLVGVSLHTP